MEVRNVYEDRERAEAYAKLEFPGTYALAFRDLPEILREQVRGRKALDFGCGAGRSTRFLKALGFEATGADISGDMIKLARERDPGGDYRLIAEADFGGFGSNAFDLVLSAFTFDNIPSMDAKIRNLRGLEKILEPCGVIVSIVSTPEIYVNEWASFSTRDFPENRRAKSGDRVRIIITDTPDRRPVEDVVCSDEDYRRAFEAAGLGLASTYKPLAREGEPYEWINETRIAPWAIYVLKKASGTSLASGG